MIKDKLEKRKKVLRWIQSIAFWLSLASCSVPLIISCIRVIPTVETKAQKWSIGGVAVIITAIILCVVLRSLISKYITKIPYTLIVVVVSVVMLVLAYCLKIIIDDAIAILWVASISSSVAFVLELVSRLCKAMAEYTDEEIRRIEHNV